MEEQFTNRRKFHRIEFDGKVRLDFRGASYDECQGINLSLTSIFIKGVFEQQPYEDCFIKFFREETIGEKGLKAFARVVRKDEEGIALEFVSMTFDTYAFLITNLIHGAEEPLVIREEMPSRCPFNITDV